MFLTSLIAAISIISKSFLLANMKRGETWSNFGLVWTGCLCFTSFALEQTCLCWGHAFLWQEELQ